MAGWNSVTIEAKPLSQVCISARERRLIGKDSDLLEGSGRAVNGAKVVEHMGQEH